MVAGDGRSLRRSTLQRNHRCGSECRTDVEESGKRDGTDVVDEHLDRGSGSTKEHRGERAPPPAVTLRQAVAVTTHRRGSVTVVMRAPSAHQPRLRLMAFTCA